MPVTGLATGRIMINKTREALLLVKPVFKEEKLTERKAAEGNK